MDTKQATLSLRYETGSYRVFIDGDEIMTQTKYVDKDRYLEMVREVKEKEPQDEPAIIRKLTPAQFSELRQVIEDSDFLNAELSSFHNLDKFIPQSLQVNINGKSKKYLFKYHARVNPTPPQQFSKIVNFICNL